MDDKEEKNNEDHADIDEYLNNSPVFDEQEQKLRAFLLEYWQAIQGGVITPYTTSLPSPSPRKSPKENLRIEQQRRARVEHLQRAADKRFADAVDGAVRWIKAETEIKLMSSAHLPLSQRVPWLVEDKYVGPVLRQRGGVALYIMEWMYGAAEAVWTGKELEEMYERLGFGANERPEYQPYKARRAYPAAVVVMDKTGREDLMRYLEEWTGIERKWETVRRLVARLCQCGVMLSMGQRKVQYGSIYTVGYYRQWVSGKWYKRPLVTLHNYTKLKRFWSK